MSKAYRVTVEAIIVTDDDDEVPRIGNRPEFWDVKALCQAMIESGTIQARSVELTAGGGDDDVPDGEASKDGARTLVALGGGALVGLPALASLIEELSWRGEVDLFVYDPSDKGTRPIEAVTMNGPAIQITLGLEGTPEGEMGQ